MIQTLENITAEASAFRAEADKTLRMIDEMNAQRERNYQRITALLDSISRQLDEIGGN